MQCWGPHTNVVRGAAQVSYNIIAIGPNQRVTLGQEGWRGNLEGLGQTLRVVNGPEEGSPGHVSKPPGCRLQGPTPRDSDSSGLQRGPLT